MAETFCLRSILPNTSGAYLLRVYSWGVQETSILGWRMEWTRESVKDHRRYVDFSNPWPITVEDDYDHMGGGVIEYLVDRGVYILPGDRAFETRDEAMAYAKEELQKQGA